MQESDDYQAAERFGPRGAWAGRALVALRLAGPILLVALLVWVVDLEKTWSALRDADAAWFIACIATFHAVMLARAARFSAIQSWFGLGKASAAYQVRLSYGTGLAALVVPQFISPFARFAMLTQDGYGRARAAAASLFEKFCDVGTYVAIGIPALLYLAARDGYPALAWAGGACVVASAAAAWVMRQRAWRAAEWLLRRIGWRGARAGDPSNDLPLPRAELPFVAAVSIATGALQFTGTYFAARAVGIDVSYVYVAAAWGIVALTMLLPVSVNGIGTREGVYVAMFGAVGVARADAFAVSITVVAAALAAAAPGALEWLYRTLPGVRAAPGRVSGSDPA